MKRIANLLNSRTFFIWLDQKIIASRTSSLLLCKASKDARLMPTSRILNAQKNPDNIHIGSHTYLRGELFIFGHAGKISIGEYCYIGEGTRIWSASEIKIGNRVLISHNVNIFDNDTHPLDATDRHNQFKDIITTGHPKKIDLKERPITVCDDALIACNCVILKGVTIGVGAIVGAGSVVTHDVAPHTIVAGNPAKLIRTLK